MEMALVLFLFSVRETASMEQNSSSLQVVNLQMELLLLSSDRWFGCLGPGCSGCVLVTNVKTNYEGNNEKSVP